MHRVGALTSSRNAPVHSVGGLAYGGGGSRARRGLESWPGHNTRFELWNAPYSAPRTFPLILPFSAEKAFSRDSLVRPPSPTTLASILAS